MQAQVVKKMHVPDATALGLTTSQRTYVELEEAASQKKQELADQKRLLQRAAEVNAWDSLLAGKGEKVWQAALEFQ